jgi:hypothetical protein
MRRTDRERLTGTRSEASVYYLPSSRERVTRPRGDEAATTVWMTLLVRRVFLELELANLQRERSRLALENQLYRSLLRREPAATQRG